MYEMVMNFDPLAFNLLFNTTFFISNYLKSLSLKLGKSLKRLVNIDKVWYPIRYGKSCKASRYFTKTGRPYKAHNDGNFCKPASGQHEIA